MFARRRLGCRYITYVDAGRKLSFDHIHFYVDEMKPLDSSAVRP